VTAARTGLPIAPPFILNSAAAVPDSSPPAAQSAITCDGSHAGEPVPTAGYEGTLGLLEPSRHAIPVPSAYVLPTEWFTRPAWNGASCWLRPKSAIASGPTIGDCTQGSAKSLPPRPLGRVQLVGAFAPVGDVVGAEVTPGCHATLPPE
jgi:hypothetical protein